MSWDCLCRLASFSGVTTGIVVGVRDGWFSLLLLNDGLKDGQRRDQDYALWDGRCFPWR